MAEKWKTSEVYLEGGLILNIDSLYQAQQYPGSAQSLVNMEPALDGGYRRIDGYSKYDSVMVPGTSEIKGAFVFNDGVLAMRDSSVFFGLGDGTWTTVTTARTGSVRYRGWKYTWSSRRIACVDGSISGYPFLYQANGTYTSLTGAPQGCKYITEFARYLWVSKGDGSVYFSAPGDETDWTTGSGAGQIVVGFDVVGLRAWRNELYVFGRNNISKISGTSSDDFVLSQVTTAIGCISDDSIQEVGGDLLYFSADGIRTIAGTARINDVELASLSRPINTILKNFIPTNAVGVVINDKSQYRLFNSQQSTPETIADGILGGIRQSGGGDVLWEWGQIVGIKVNVADSAYLSNGRELVVHGSWDGYIYEQELGGDFNGTAVQSVYQTPNLVFDDPEVRKVIYKLCAFIKCEGDVSLDVSTIYDYGVPGIVQPNTRNISFDGDDISFFDDTPPALFDNDVLFDSKLDGRVCTNLVGSGRNVSFVFTTTGIVSYNIRSLTIQYALAARR